jgi:B12-binding domain/radical SAM domain protein
MKSDTNLKVIAISAPQWVAHAGHESQKSLNSTDPFSLQNAMRLAVWNAQKGIGHWGNSNLANRKELKKSIRLMNYCEDEIHDFIDVINEEKPNLLFIGAMTLSYPGAIILAKCAKEILKDNVFIVLGGKHCTETFWNRDNEYFHHAASPLKIIQDSRDLPQNVFDLVVSGDGEEVITQIGEVIGQLISEGKGLCEFYSHIEKLTSAKGNWIAGWVDDSFSIQVIKSNELPLDYERIPSPSEVFGITANFPVFEADITGHAYSDMSKGCIYDCFFCSERKSVNGEIQQKNTAPHRLYNQFQKIKEVGIKENKAKVISAFVEDSIILSGSISLLKDFNKLLSENPLNIKWGCQLTIDSFLHPQMLEVVKELKKNGLVYIFFGMETINEDIAKKMSKNTHKNELWKSRNEHVIEEMSKLGLKTGFCILWGLGEHQSERINHLKTLKNWQLEYGGPNVISLNWAVKHPLRSFDAKYDEYDYTQWGTPKNSEYLEIFIEIFGEASTEFNILNSYKPQISELRELKKLYYDLIQSYVSVKQPIKK